MAHRFHPNHAPDPPDSTASAGGPEEQPVAPTGGDHTPAQPVSEPLPASAPEAAAVAAAPGAAPAPTAPGGAVPFTMPAFGPRLSPAQSKAIDLLSDVNLNVKIELGRTRMLVEDVLRLSEGAVVELDKLAGDPVDIYVNDRPIARGEVLVLNDNFCVRIHEIIQNPADGEVPKAARKAS